MNNSTKTMHHIPSRIYSSFMRLLFVVINMSAIFLLIRGHNLPGGGFIAGLLTAISFVLLLMSRDPKRLAKLVRVNPLFLMTSGLTLAVSTAIFPTFLGRNFFDHLYIEIMDVRLNSAFLFDFGVYTVVVGASVKITYLLRRSLAYNYTGGKY